jgi:hypothetical protein
MSFRYPRGLLKRLAELPILAHRQRREQVYFQDSPPSVTLIPVWKFKGGARKPKAGS